MKTTKRNQLSIRHDSIPGLDKIISLLKVIDKGEIQLYGLSADVKVHTVQKYNKLLKRALKINQL